MSLALKKICPIVYKTTIASDRLALIGSGILFDNRSFFGLAVGDKVNQIGDGRVNGCFRTDLFNYGLKYVGLINCQSDNEVESMFAFDTGEIYQGDTIYLLYGSTGKEIYTRAVYSRKYKSFYTRFYHASFNIINDTK